MAFQTAQAPRPILQRGPVPMPVVSRALVKRDDPTRLPEGQHRHWKSKSRFIFENGHYKLAPDVIAEIRKLRGDGLSYAAVAIRLEINKRTVVRYSRDVAIPQGRRLTCWEGGLREKPERNRAFAERLRRAGFSYREIGENLNCSETAARKLLLDLPPDSSVFLPTRRMVSRVAEATGVPCKQIRRGQFDTGTKTAAEINKARHIVFWLLREHVGYSFPAIGKSVGGFHHTSVMHGYRRACAAAEIAGVTKQIRFRTAITKLWNADWREVTR